MLLEVSNDKDGFFVHCSSPTENLTGNPTGTGNFGSDSGIIPMGSRSHPSQHTHLSCTSNCKNWQQESIDEIKLKTTVFREKPCNPAAVSPMKKTMDKKDLGINVLIF